MTDADFQWNVRGGERLEAGLRIAPGGMLEGSLTVTPQSDVTCKALRIRLGWHTKSRGNRVNRVVTESNVFNGVLPVGQPATFAFQFQMPLEPWSYTGHYVSIVWELVAEIEQSFMLNPKSVLPIILRPA
jgi:hypothetical protein